MNGKFGSYWIALLLSLCCQAAFSGTLYQSSDKESGQLTFSDSPMDGSTAIHVPEIQGYAPQPVQTEGAPRQTQEAPKAAFYTVSISAPTNDEFVVHGVDTLTVQAHVKPDLETGHGLEVFLDDKSLGFADSYGSYTLPRLHRGTHIVEVRVASTSGDKPPKQNPARVEFYQQRLFIKK